MTACSSSEKQATSYYFSVVSCTYNSTEDTTRVVWYSDLVNDSIYDMKEESFKFNLYNGSTFIRTTDYVTYSITVKHGKSEASNRNFVANGQVTDVKINTWTAKFSSVWETYMPWFIATIVVASILAIIYAVIMILNDLELADLGEFLGEHLWTIAMVAIPFVPYLISSLSSSVWSWVPPLIIGGGIVALAIVVLLSHLIKFVVELIADSGNGGYVPARKTKDITFNSYDEDIEDYLNDGEALSQFTVAQLREYCRDNGFKGYSTMSKSQLVELIMSGETAEADDGDDKPASTKKATTSKVKKIKFDDIAGLDEVKKTFKEKVIMPFEHPELFENFVPKSRWRNLALWIAWNGQNNVCRSRC